MVSIVQALFVACTVIGMGFFVATPFVRVVSYKWEGSLAEMLKAIPDDSPSDSTPTPTPKPTANTNKNTTSLLSHHVNRFAAQAAAKNSTTDDPMNSLTLKMTIICSSISCSLCSETPFDFLKGGPECTTASVSDVKEMNAQCGTILRSIMAFSILSVISAIVCLVFLFLKCRFLRLSTILPFLFGIVVALVGVTLGTSKCDSRLSAFKSKIEAGIYLATVGIALFGILIALAVSRGRELMTGEPESEAAKAPPTPLMSLNSAVSVTPRVPLATDV